MRYWVRRHRQTHGPFSVAELRKLRDIGPRTLVCPDGAKGGRDWKPLEQFEELRGLVADMSETGRRPTAPLAKCSKCGRENDGEAAFCDACGLPLHAGHGHQDRGAAECEPPPLPSPVPPPVPADTPPLAQEVLSSAGKGIVGMLEKYGIVLVMIIGGCAIVAGINNMDTDDPSVPSIRESARPIPQIAYADEHVTEVVDLSNFRWTSESFLSFHLRFKGQIAYRGTLRYEIHDAAGVIIDSGTIGAFISGTKHTKVYEQRILVMSDKRKRMRKIVFSF